MNKQKDISRVVEQTMESLEGIKRAEPTPFLFTRVKARLEREEKNAWEKLAGILARPVVAFASLFIIVGVNAFLLFSNPDTGGGSNSPGVVQSNNITEDYFILATNNYDYENLEP